MAHVRSAQQARAPFFWETRSKSRSRFNLLLLEYNEYLLEDLSVSVQVGSSSSSPTQGRLKLCSRSLIFEPIDVKRPIVKYPFRSLKFSTSSSSSSDDVLTLSTALYYELKANGKIGPYKQVVVQQQDTDPTSLILFRPLHTDLSLLQTKVDRLLGIFTASVELGSGQAQALLQQFIHETYLRPNMPLLFDTSQLVDFHERLILKEPVEVKRVRPLVSNVGLLMLTESRVYFQPFSINNVGDTVQVVELRQVARVYCRRFLLRQIGLEFLMRDGSSALFAFSTRVQRDDFFLQVLPLLSSATTAPPPLSAVTRKWQQREISNFEYLMYLNNEADRSINDLTQYPVFPHILADFASDKLDLDKPETFRDLSKPTGALNPSRLEYFRQRYASMPDEDPALGLPPPFLYGTHYSTPGYVLHYLVRVAPEFMLCLQNGKFDAPDRMFHSLADMWESVLTNPTDLKELIPEFFTGDGSFLLNADDLDLGRRHTGGRLGDVTLPPWASRPSDFIRKHAQALESEHVSAHLHQWIDLIFGFKQKGEAAVESDNLYYYLTYEGAVDLESFDRRDRAALEVQIQEFGQTPRQLFASPHPSRNDPPDSGSPLILTQPYVPHSASGAGGGGGAGAGADQILDVGMVKLGSDFHKEVQEQLLASASASASSPGAAAVRTPAKGSASSVDASGAQSTSKRSSVLGQLGGLGSIFSSSVEKSFPSWTLGGGETPKK